MADFDPSMDWSHLRYNYTWILSIEDNFDPVRPTVWMQNNWTQSILLSALYVVMIYGGRYIMRNRAPYDLKWPLVLWNAALAVFSITGMVRYLPDFVWVLSKFGFVHSMCVCAFHQGVTGFWTEMFALSKAVELGDTAFLVLRKRPIMFLHWYHHITVMIYTWHAFKDHTAAGRWFIMMNYSVHAIMYTYYALRAAGFRFPKFIPMAITISQLSQMVVGIVVAVASYLVKRSGGTCRQTPENMQLAFAMYMSYFLLFVHFFYQAYFKTAKYDKKPAADRRQDTTEPVMNGVTHEGKARKTMENGHLVSNGFAKDSSKISNGIATHVTNGYHKVIGIPSGISNEHSNGEVMNGFAKKGLQDKYEYSKYD